MINLGYLCRVRNIRYWERHMKFIRFAPEMMYVQRQWNHDNGFYVACPKAVNVLLVTVENAVKIFRGVQIPCRNASSFQTLARCTINHSDTVLAQCLVHFLYSRWQTYNIICNMKKLHCTTRYMYFTGLFSKPSGTTILDIFQDVLQRYSFR